MFVIYITKTNEVALDPQVWKPTNHNGLNKKNTGVQEFRSSGVQENPETEDLPGDRCDLTGEQRLQSPTENP